MANQLTPEQKAAAFSFGKPTVLMAAAGSGKTTVLVERYLALIRQGFHPRQILAVTFTTDAAEQLKTRIAARLSQESETLEKLADAVESSPYIGTLHSFCYLLINQFGSHLDLKPIQKIQSAFEFANRFESRFDDWIEGLAESDLRALLKFYSQGEIKGVVRHILDDLETFEVAKKHPLENVREQELAGLLDRLITPFCRELQAAFRSEGIYSFSDLESLALKLLTEVPAVRARVQTDLAHLLIDEFQDTSPIQWEIIKHVMGEDYTKLFIVGDPKQSIYGFRQAEVKLFLQTAEQLEKWGGVQFELTTNFRSAPELLGSINSFGERLFSQSAINYSPMQAGELSNEGKKISPLYFAERAEVSTLCQKVKEVIQAGSPPESIVILFRVSDKIPIFQQALEKSGIPAIAERSHWLNKTYDCLDLLNFLKVVADPLDDFALSAFLLSPYVGMDYRQVADLLEAPLPDRSPRGLKQILAKKPPALLWLLELWESGESNAQQCLSALFRHTGVWPKHTEAWLQLLEPLVDADYTVDELVHLQKAWLKEDILLSSQKENSVRHGVRLMTIHGAKGLEYDHVFLVDNLRKAPRRAPILRIHPEFALGLKYREADERVNSKTYDTIGEIQNLREEEESKRVLYVALTRAKKSFQVLLPLSLSEIPKATWGAFFTETLREI